MPQHGPAHNTHKDPVHNTHKIDTSKFTNRVKKEDAERAALNREQEDMSEKSLAQDAEGTRPFKKQMDGLRLRLKNGAK